MMNDEVLNALFLKESVSEILLLSPTEIWFEEHGQLKKFQCPLKDEMTYECVIRNLYQQLNKEPSLDIPFASGELNGWRVQMVAPPVSQFPQVSFRRQITSYSRFENLQAAKWCCDTDADSLRQLVRERKNIFVVGPTSSGKTTVLNALLAETKPYERSLLIEDVPELKPPNPVSSSLLSRWDAQGVLKEISLSDLLRHSLRLRPDRLVLGEVRGPEAKDLLMALATGHNGSMGTLHAEDVQGALMRLEMLIQLGAPQWSLQTIRQLMKLCLQAIVVLKRDHNGFRRLEGIYEIASLEDFGFTIQKIN